MAQLIHGTTINGHIAIHAGNMSDHSLATTSYVTTQINNLINGAPGALNTLDELAAALGDDASFATSVTNSLGGKLSLTGGVMSGRLTLKSISGVEQTVPNEFGAYLHLGAWGVGRTDSTAVLVNTAYRADYATDLFDMNISRFTNNSGYITSSGSISGNAATATAAQNATFLTQPNATWAGRVQLGGNGAGSGVNAIAVVQATDGNLHMDNGLNKEMYLNYYHNGKIYLNGGTYFISANGSQYNGNAATATTAGALTSMNISQFTNNSGYLTSLPSHNHDGRYLLLSGGTLTGDLLSTHPLYPGYNNGAVGSQGSYYLYGDTGNSGIRTNGNFLANGDIYLGTRGNWLSTYLNQAVRTDSAPSFSSVTLGGSQLTGTQVNGLSNMLGVTTLPYSCDITVGGDPDRFYAVQFWGGDQDVWRRIIIKRGYGETAPWDPIGTGQHHGGLLLDWEGNFGGWGGAEYADRLRVFNESYTNVCADMFIYSHSMSYVFMLRGGGAVYHLFSDQPINGFYQSGSPDILYSSAELSYDHSNPGYDVYAPAPLGLGSVNSSRIDGLRLKKQSLLDGRYLIQGSDISGISTISATNFRASNAFYLNGASYYLNSSNGGIYTNARFETASNLFVGGNSYLGNASGDETHINDILRVGATDSGDAHFYFGEGGSAGSDYGSHWYWDSGYTFTWNTRNAGTDTALFDYVTNDTTYLNWRRNFHMQNREINYVSQLHFNAGLYLQTYNDRNLIIKGNSSSDAGIEGRNAAGNNVFQIYGNGSDYGFLNGTWAAWDIRKTKNAAMYMNNDSTYYLQTNSTSNFYALNIQGSAVVHAGNIGSQSVSYATTAGALTSMNISQFTNNSGYITSVGNITRLWAESHPNDYYVRANWTGSYWQLTSNHPSPVQVGYADNAGAVAWTNVSSRPTALSQFSNDLGNYGGFLTSLPSHTHDDRYYTESESDSRFVNADGDSMSGSLTIGAGAAYVGTHGTWTGEQNKIQWHSTHLYLQNTGGGNFFFRRADGTNLFNLDNNGSLIISGDLYPNGQGTYRLYVANSGLWTNGNFGASGDLYLGTRSTWLSSWLNQSVQTGASPSFANVYLTGIVGNNSSQTRDKLRVWDSSQYTIGMKSGYNYGHLGNNEYAMSFQMNDNSGRGFWWGDTSHGDDHGAASLTTDGRMVIATSLSIGEGESTVTPSSTTLYVKGSTDGADVLAVDGVNGRLFTITDSVLDTIYSVNTIAGLPILEVLANSTVNLGPFSAPIVINASGISTPSHGTSANWFTAFNKRPTGIGFSGSSTKTLTLTLGDGSTLTAAFNDIDTDTNTDGQTLSISGSTLTISGGNSITIPSGGISQATADGLYQPLENQRLSTGNAPTFNDIYNNSWFRNNAVNTGLYNQSSGNHFYSRTAAKWGITGNGGNIHLEFRSNHESTLRGVVYADTSNQIGFLNNGEGWAIRANSSNNVFVHGTDLTINADNAGSSNINMNDGDEGARIIHCNSNRIGFLTQAGSWGAYCDDSGNWTAANFSGSSSGTNTGDQTNISGNSATTSQRNFDYLYASSYLESGGAVYGTIFYDNNDRDYYADFNTTSNSAIRVRGGMLMGPNPSWGAYLQVGGNGNESAYASVVTTNGNLHLDAADGRGTYINHYSGGTIYFGTAGTWTITGDGSYYNGTSAVANSVAWGNVSSRPTALSQFSNDLGNYGGWITSSGSISGNAATVTVNSGNGSASWYPILWHSGNNVYSSSGVAEIYPAGGYARFQYINTTDNDESGITRFVIKNGDSYHRSATTTVAADIIRGVASGTWSITAARANRANGNFYIDDNYGNTVVGVYTSTRFQGVFAMGDAYKLAADGSSCANHYGIAWSHPNAGGEAANLTNHGMLVQNVGRTWTAISDTIWCIGDITAFSDARVKTNIEVIDNPLERLSKVRGVTFNRTDLEHKDKRYAGVIAQEMREALPEAVSENANGELSVSYGNTVSLLIESIKAQQVQIEELKAEVKKLRGE
jgi:hypothetical protein